MAFLRQRIRFLIEYQPLWRSVLIISAAAIIYLATTSQPYPIPSAASDKVNHILAFFQLAVVTRLAWPALGKVWVIAGLMAFGLAIEVVQAQLPYRTFAISDILADGVGIAIGLLPCPDLLKPRPQNNRSGAHSHNPP